MYSIEPHCHKMILRSNTIGIPIRVWALLYLCTMTEGGCKFHCRTNLCGGPVNENVDVAQLWESSAPDIYPPYPNFRYGSEHVFTTDLVSISLSCNSGMQLNDFRFLWVDHYYHLQECCPYYRIPLSQHNICDMIRCETFTVSYFG